MNKRTLILIVSAIVLFAAYAYFFTDWFDRKHIQISYRAFPDRRADPTKVATLTFYLDKEYPVTSLKFFRNDEVATNKYPVPIWHLVCASNAAKVTEFEYGRVIRGMKPANARTRAPELVPDQSYKVVVEAGKVAGEKTFQPHLPPATGR
jgi:hypothetical protein